MPIPKQAGPVRPQSAKDLVYRTVRSWIIEGALSPGERLSDEELAEHFSVSRTPIREAFQILESQKLIRVLPGKATVVAELELEQMDQYYLPLARLQGLAAHLAASRVTPEDIEELKTLNSHCGLAAGEDAKSLIEADDAFHARILALAGNELVTEFSHILLSHVRRAEHRFYCTQPGGGKSTAEHDRMIAALAAGDGPEADRAMQENWLSTVRHLMNAASGEKSRLPACPAVDFDAVI